MDKIITDGNSSVFETSDYTTGIDSQIDLAEQLLGANGIELTPELTELLAHHLLDGFIAAQDTNETQDGLVSPIDAFFDQVGAGLKDGSLVDALNKLEANRADRQVVHPEEEVVKSGILARRRAKKERLEETKKLRTVTYNERALKIESIKPGDNLELSLSNGTVVDNAQCNIRGKVIGIDNIPNSPQTVNLEVTRWRQFRGNSRFVNIPVLEGATIVLSGTTYSWSSSEWGRSRFTQREKPIITFNGSLFDVMIDRKDSFNTWDRFLLLRQLSLNGVDMFARADPTKSDPRPGGGGGGGGQR